MVNKNILARIEKEDVESGLQTQKCKLIIHYLAAISSMLCHHCAEPHAIEETLKSTFPCFCMKFSWVARLLRKLSLWLISLYMISAPRNRIFLRILFLIIYSEIWEKICFLRLAIMGLKVINQKSAGKLVKSCAKYIHPYVEGVLNRKSISCELFRNQCHKEGFELKRL